MSHERVPVRVLFVCLGNICRSPMAEAVLRHEADRRGIADRIEIDSAGTGDWHVGNLADSRTLKTLDHHGIPAPSRARQLRAADFEEFDVIFAMDGGNVGELLRWKGAQPAKVSLFMDQILDGPKGREIPDPYYGSMADFEQVFEMVSAASADFLDSVVALDGDENLT